MLGLGDFPTIDAVELNPQIIDLVKDKYADFAGQIYSKANLTVYTDEARGYIATTKKIYEGGDVVLLRFLTIVFLH